MCLGPRLSWIYLEHLSCEWTLPEQMSTLVSVVFKVTLMLSGIRSLCSWPWRCELMSAGARQLCAFLWSTPCALGGVGSWEPLNVGCCRGLSSERIGQDYTFVWLVIGDRVSNLVWALGSVNVLGHLRLSRIQNTSNKLNMNWKLHGLQKLVSVCSLVLHVLII